MFWEIWAGIGWATAALLAGYIAGHHFGARLRSEVGKHLDNIHRESP